MKRSRDSPFVFYGNPFKRESNSIPEWRQEVRDEKGRKRFHGAYTGGFSAGYFNTVGSKEGWVPSEFKSSRKDRSTQKRYKVEDFYDDEDRQDNQEFFTRNILHNLSKSREIQQILKSDFGGLTELLSISTGDWGKRILEHFAKAHSLKESILQDTADAFDIQEYFKFSYIYPKGLDLEYKASVRIKALSRSDDPTKYFDTDTEYFEEPKRLALTNLRNRNPLFSNKGRIAPALAPTSAITSRITANLLSFENDDEQEFDRKVNTDQRGRLLFRPSRKPLAVSRRIEKMIDGSEPPPGFVLDEPVYFKSANLPTIPDEFMPLGYPKGSSGAVENTKNLSRDQRQLVLGTMVAQKSVFDYLTVEQQQRIAKYSGRDDLIEAKGQAHQSLDTDVIFEPSVAKAALERNFNPYKGEKSQRYFTFLKKFAGQDDIKLDRHGLSEEDYKKELIEFSHAASVFQPMSDLMKSRFQPSSEQSSHDPNTEKIEISDIDKARRAAFAEEYGQKTRIVEPFVPHNLICKRLGINFQPVFKNSDRENDNDPEIKKDDETAQKPSMNLFKSIFGED